MPITPRGSVRAKLTVNRFPPGASMARSDELFALTRRLYRAPACGSLRWRPLADVHRSAHGWLVKFELAGVDEEQVSVTLSGRWLLLRGSRADLDLVEGCRSHTMEIAYSRFERLIELPEPVEGAALEVTYRRGMFLVHLITKEGAP